MRLIFTTCSFESSSSASGSVGVAYWQPVRNSKRWHISSVSTSTSTGRLRGTSTKYACLASEQRVVLPVRRVALGLEQLVEHGAVLAAGGEVEVDLDAAGPVRPLGRMRPDRHAAHEPDEEPALVGGRHDPEGLGERVLQRSRRDAGLIGHRAVPL